MSTLGLVVTLSGMAATLAMAQGNLVHNGSFEQGDRAPAGWTLSGEPGTWETEGHSGKRCVSVEGVSPGQNHWWEQSEIPVQPFSTYRFSYWTRTAPGSSGGCIISGPDFCNSDTNAGQRWEPRSFVFVTGREQTTMTVRVGHWHKQGKVFFDDVECHPVQPVHRSLGDLTLGAGERIEAGKYLFTAPLTEEGRNYSRVLDSFTARFNTNRWAFGPGATLTYRHHIHGTAQTSGNVRVSIIHYVSGHCVIEASTDGAAWVRLGTAQVQGVTECRLPQELLPAEAVFIRFRSPQKTEEDGELQPGSFQIDGYTYQADLTSSPPDMVGSTRYLDVETADPRLAVTVEDLGALTPGGDNAARLRLRNLSGRGLMARVELALTPDHTGQEQLFRDQATLPANGERTLTVPYQVRTAGPHTLRLTASEAQTSLFAATTSFTVPDLYAADFGYPLTADPACELWWCEGTYKVSRERGAPTGEPRPVQVAAAGNEFEPFQVVLRPTRDLQGLTVTMSDLIGPGDARLPAAQISVCQVWYHQVTQPTDEAGCVGWWPDALPPLDRPLDLPAGRNQPLWITVHVPAGTPAGEYRGTLALKANGWEATVPVELRVWGFTLPAESHVGSGFGLDPGLIWRYHNLTDEEDRERVWELYMQSFRDHRIAPYAFWRRGIRVDIPGVAWTGGEIVPQDPLEGQRCLKIVDDSDSTSVAASYSKTIPVDPHARYTLTFAARTAQPGQQYLVTFPSYDAAGQWISGHNLDVPFTGTGQWQRETLTFVPAVRSPQVRSLGLTLRPALWTEDGRLTGTAWFDDLQLVQEGSGENLLTDGGFEAGYDAIHVNVDFSEWDKEAEKYLDGFHFNSFALPVMGMGSGTFHSRVAGQMGPFMQGTEGYRRLMREYLMQVQDHLEQRGWLHKAYVYWFDEPEPKDYDFVREGMTELKLAGPKIRRMLTEEPVEPLFGYVDLWCPLLPNHDPQVCAERQKLGETIWWYVCCGPRAPWPGLFIDHNAVDLRVWLWMTWKWNVQGILVWQTNWWTSACAFPDSLQNPWDDPMAYVAGYGLPAGYVGYWGNGDGRFLYPPNRDVAHDRSPYVSGPVSSLRWEMLREGIEDFEYFRLLRDLVAQHPGCPEAELLEVPAQIVAGQTEFTKDPLPMYAHRQKLAEAIERLGAAR